MKTEDVTLEATQGLFEFLQGNCPENLTIKHMPNLNEEQAFAVIYYLQEQMYLIPDTYEMCDECLTLYNSDDEGTIVDGKQFCDDCCYDGLYQDKYNEYQLNKMIKHKLSIHALFEKLEKYRCEQVVDITLTELFKKWQSEVNDIWVSEEDDWETFRMESQEYEGLSGYEKYQLEWMDDHNYSIQDIIVYLESMRSKHENINKSLIELFELWEKEIGFYSHDIWANKQEWNDIELAKQTIDTTANETIEYLSILEELHDAIKEGYLMQDEKKPGNVLVYRKKSELNPEGWYSDNIFTVAFELLKNKDSYQDFKTAIADVKRESEKGTTR